MDPFTPTQRYLVDHCSPLCVTESRSVDTWFTTESEELTSGCGGIVTDNGTGIDGNMVLSNGSMKGEEITGGIDGNEVLSNGSMKGEVITGGIDGIGLINGLKGRG